MGDWGLVVIGAGSVVAALAAFVAAQTVSYKTLAAQNQRQQVQIDREARVFRRRLKRLGQVVAEMRRERIVIEDERVVAQAELVEMRAAHKKCTEDNGLLISSRAEMRKEIEVLRADLAEMRVQYGKQTPLQ